MTGQQLVDGYIIGSPEIERMRKEIDLVLGSTVQLITHRTPRTKRMEYMNFESAGLYWRLMSGGNKFNFEVIDYLRISNSSTVYDSRKGASQMLMGDVMRLHSQLPTAMEEIGKLFNIKSWMKPLLDAAAAAEKKGAAQDS